jgi:hypothetical protein
MAFQAGPDMIRLRHYQLRARIERLKGTLQAEEAKLTELQGQCAHLNHHRLPDELGKHVCEDCGKEFSP